MLTGWRKCDLFVCIVAVNKVIVMSLCQPLQMFTYNETLFTLVFTKIETKSMVCNVFTVMSNNKMQTGQVRNVEN